MDKFLLDKNFEKYKAQKLHLDSYIIKKMGIIGNQTILKINDFHLYCIPYVLALRSCSVLMILDRGEIEFFTKSFDKIHSIHFVFQNNLYKKPISLFLRCKITNLKIMNPETNHCQVYLDYTNIPNDYIEILVNTFKRNEALLYLYKNEQFRKKIIQRDSFKLLNIDDNLHLRTEKGTEPAKMTVINSTMSMMRIIGEDIQGLYTMNTRIQVELFHGDDSFIIDGAIVAENKSMEIPGYKILDLKLEFSSYLTDLLYQYFKKESEKKT